MITPLEWLALWVASVAALVVLTVIGTWPVARRRGYVEGESDRHRHRHGDPTVPALLELPRAGRLAVAPEPEWTFFGAQVEPPPGPAEYELLTGVAPAPIILPEPITETIRQLDPAAWASTIGKPDSEPPIDTGEIQAITDRVDEMIAAIRAQSNYDQHTMRAD